MPGRSGGDYRYGFNGKEKDKDGEFGSLTHYDYGFRIYNPGVGRFLSVDPLASSYPFFTPYQFASNSAISGIDIDGLERAGIDVWNGVYYQSDTYLEKSDEERIADAEKKAKLGGIAIAGAVAVNTGAILYEAAVGLFWQSAVWLSHPLNQTLVAEVGALTAAAIDPDPTAQYSTGASDELGNAIGAGIRWFFRGTSSKIFKGSSAVVKAGVTPTSHNPIVSTLYGIYSRTKYGKGTLLIGDATDLLKVKKLSGLLKHDQEIALKMLPSEFSGVAKELNLDDATKILKDMGYNIPERINSLGQLDAALKEVPQMTGEQIETFMEQANKLIN